MSGKDGAPPQLQWRRRRAGGWPRDGRLRIPCWSSLQIDRPGGRLSQSRAPL